MIAEVPELDAFIFAIHQEEQEEQRARDDPPRRPLPQEASK